MRGSETPQPDTRTRQGRGDIHPRRRCQPGGAVTALPFLAFEWTTQARVMHARQRSAVQKTDVPQCEISGLGFLLLCTLPSTVQSSIAFTSIAGGNVPAAVCAASASSLIG